MREGVKYLVNFQLIANSDLGLATLFQKLPDLKLAVPVEKINYTPLDRDVGIVDLPVTF